MTMPTNPGDLARVADIRARADAATDGPWDSSGWVYGNAQTESYGVWAGKPDGDNGVPIAKTSRREQGHHDAEFIAAARADVPWLLDRLAAETERADGLRARIEALHRHDGNHEHWRDCIACDQPWPCPTIAALSPAEETP